jgi:chaperonin GroES
MGETTKLVDVKGCARCGGEHPKMPFQPLDNPATEMDWFGTCPKTYQPVLMRFINDELTGDMRLEPIHDQLVVVADPPEEKSKGGIVLPDRAKKIPWRGTIIAVGPEVGKRRMIDSIMACLPEHLAKETALHIRDNNPALLEVDQLKVGDRIYWAQYSGTQYEWCYKHYFILQAREVLGKIVPGSYGEGGAEYKSTMTDADFDLASKVRPKLPHELPQE